MSDVNVKESNINKITKSTTLTGDLVDNESEGLDIAGTVNGNVKTNGKINITGVVNGDVEAQAIYTSGARIRGNLTASSAIKVGNETVIIGNVTAETIALAGAVKGNLDIKDTAVISETGIFQGDVKGKAIEIAAGAVVEGSIDLCYAEVPSGEYFKKFD